MDRSKMARCIRCGGPLNTRPDRLCSTCTHGDRHDNPEEDSPRD